jgi:hypothetical protein
VNVLTRYKLFLWIFSRFKVPMIGYLAPKLVVINDHEVIIKILLKRRSKNHLHSMYFGALAVGADVAGGLHGFYHANKANVKVSLAFKSLEAQFLKRPESDVFFICTMGQKVKEMITTAIHNNERVNQVLNISAFTNYPHNPEEVAKFKIELSLRVVSKKS